MFSVLSMNASLFSVLWDINSIVHFSNLSLWMLFSVWILFFFALCARLHGLSIEYILNLDWLFYWFLSEASCEEFLVMMICQPILL